MRDGNDYSEFIDFECGRDQYTDVTRLMEIITYSHGERNWEIVHEAPGRIVYRVREGTIANLTRQYALGRLQGIPIARIEELSPLAFVYFKQSVEEQSEQQNNEFDKRITGLTEQIRELKQSIARDRRLIERLEKDNQQLRRLDRTLSIPVAFSLLIAGLLALAAVTTLNVGIMFAATIIGVVGLGIGAYRLFWPQGNKR